MKKLLTLLLLLAGFAMHSQIKGKITTTTGQGIPFVSVTVQNTYIGTTANADGYYELPVKSPGNYTLIFQSIGYKTKNIGAELDAKAPLTFNVTLMDESYELSEVVITNGEDPAYEIIRNAIAERKKNGEKSGRFEADFYSKGMYKVNNVPKRVMGIKVDVEGEQLDSTRSGIIYLAEAVSHITVDYPNQIKERVIATRVSGQDNGYSYNNARENNYDLYSDYINFEDAKMISPIAKGAIGYYKFKYEGATFDGNHQINKIKVIPRRKREPVFEGYIYIVEDSWAIYAVDLNIKGYRIQQPVMENFNLKQNFSYNQTNDIWAKNSQTLNFNAGMFGMTFNGKYTHVYSNYVFHDKFEKNAFGRELAIIEENSAKKDTAYWNSTRPVPLTIDEVADYKKKDSILAFKKSDVYRDSIKKNQNRFHVFDVISGYNYSKRDSLRSFSFNYSGLTDKISYNTVQGWNTTTSIDFNYYNSKSKRFFNGKVNFNYGIAEDRLRVNGSFSRYIKNVGTFYFSGGNTIEQFNPDEPITPFINAVSTLFFKDNYMKLYDNTFAKVSYGKTLFKKISLNGSIEYLRRRPLYNNADWVFIKNDHDYISNNPLEPYNYTSAPFMKHNIMKASLEASFIFTKDYISYHNFQSPVWGGNYPDIRIRYEKAFAGSEKQYEYDHISAKASYKFEVDNKGDFAFSFKGGKFFNAENIAFMDYKHFNGNQTHVGTKQTYTDVFNLLPYYSHSTNDSYFEAHIEHNFKGYVMNKIPLLNVLQWNLVVGYHSLATPHFKPYHEATIGFDNIGIGPFRFLRLDYVRAYQGGFKTDGIVFGAHFFLD